MQEDHPTIYLGQRLEDEIQEIQEIENQKFKKLKISKLKIRKSQMKKQRDSGFFTLMDQLEERGPEQEYGSLLLMMKVIAFLSN